MKKLGFIKNKILTTALALAIFFLVGGGVYINIQKQRAVDRSRLPQKVELSSGYQKWSTNLKKKNINVEAEEFKLLEESEVLNTKWMTVTSVDQPGQQQVLDTKLASAKSQEKTALSPSGTQFIDYRDVARDGYSQGQVRLYGLKEDKILDTRALGCNNQANCYFDRGYFLDNDTFVVTEFSLKDQGIICEVSQVCTYTIKLHLVDMLKNKHFVYVSLPKDLNLVNMKPLF